MMAVVEIVNMAMAAGDAMKGRCWGRWDGVGAAAADWAVAMVMMIMVMVMIKLVMTMAMVRVRSAATICQLFSFCQNNF